MEKIGNMTQLEVRRSESEQDKYKRQYKQWLKVYAKASMFGRLGQLMKCALLFNIHETDGYLTENVGWADYCNKIQIPPRTASKYLNVARGLIKYCPGAVMMQDKKFIFDVSKIEAEFKSMLQSEVDVTFETLIQIGMDANGLRNYFHDEQAGQEIKTDDALNMLGIDIYGIAPSLPGENLEIPAIKQGNLFDLETRILKAGYIYNQKLRNYTHPDGTEMTLDELGEFVGPEEAFLVFGEVTKVLKPAKETLVMRIEDLKKYAIAYSKAHPSPAAEKTMKDEVAKCLSEVKDMMYEIGRMMKEDEA